MAGYGFTPTAPRCGMTGKRTNPGSPTEEDWFEYRLEHDPRFLRRIEQARNSLRAGHGVRLEDLEDE